MLSKDAMDKQRDIQTLDPLERTGLSQGHRGLGCTWTGPGLLIQLFVPCTQGAFPLPHAERWALPSIPAQAQGSTRRQPSRQPVPRPLWVMEMVVWPLSNDQLRPSWGWKEKFFLVRGKFSTFVSLYGQFLGQAGAPAL